jgi:hypothetical protein
MKVIYNDEKPQMPDCLDCGWEITGMIWGKGVCYDCHNTWTCACVRDGECNCNDVDHYEEYEYQDY